MNRKSLLVTALAVLALLLSVGGVTAQGNGPGGGLSSPVAQGNGPTGNGDGVQGPQSPNVVASPTFTYQGQLKNGGSAVNGNCDIAFRLFDAATAGTEQNVITTTVPVTNGLFTVGLNFGYFYGDARWLDIRVRCPAGSGSYSTLSPRQAVTAAPYAAGLVPGLSVSSVYTNWNMIYLQNNATENLSYGVRAVSYSNSGGKGVSGESYGTEGIGVFGSALYNGAGVYGATGIYQSGVYTVAGNYGGYFDDNTACVGDPFSCGVGVMGISGEGSITNTHPFGAYYPAGGEFAGPNGVIGAAAPGSFDGYGVAAFSDSVAGYALYAYHLNGGTAGYFIGNVTVNGDLSATGVKPFKIDNPLDPANSYLYHYAVESPQVQNMYNGTAVLDANGEATIQLPAYFSAVNTGEYRYSLTAIGAPMPNLYIAQEVEGGTFKIAGGAPGKKVSWTLYAQRNDPYLRDHPHSDSVQKPEHEQGTYLYPQGYGQPASAGLNAARQQTLAPAPQR